MYQLRAALGWLTATPRDVARLDRWRTRLARAGYFYSLVAGVIVLRQAWFSGSWREWAAFWLLCAWILGGALEYLRPGPAASETELRQRLMNLRDAAASGNSLVAPPFEPQPASVPQQEPLARRTLVGRFRSPATRRPSMSPVSAAGVFALWGLVYTGFALVDGPRSWLLVTVPVLLSGLVDLWLWLRRRRPIIVFADDVALTWWQGKRERRVAWGDIRAFCVLAEPVKWAWRTFHCVYLVYTPDAVLAWEVGGSAPTYLRDDSNHLASLIVTKTGLPLRDLTAAAKEDASATQRRPDPNIPAGPQPPRPRRRILRLAAIPLYIALVVPALGLAAVTQQGRLYHDRLASAEGQFPLFRDSLAADDGRWPLQAGDARQGDIAFQRGAYVLTPQGDAALATWPAPTFGDAVVEVTVAQEQISYTLTGAGLVLRADDATRRMVVFTITPDGSWRLSSVRYDAGYNDSSSIAQGDSDAIHRGNDATNRLSAMLRGSWCTLFINGQFVGSYDLGVSRPGYAGVYSGGDVQRAAFTDFADYPVSPPSPLFAV